MESFMEQPKAFANLIYAIFTESFTLFLKLNTIICSLVEYKPVARALIKRQQRSSIACIITLQMKHLFCEESNKLAEFMVTKNNPHVQNILIYKTEVTLTL